MKTLVIILGVFVLSEVLAGCKSRSSGEASSLKDTSAPRFVGQAPGTHYALKSGIRRLFDSIRLVQSGVEDGAYVYTVTDFSFSQFENNLNGVTGSILMNLSIDASKGQAVTARVNAGVNLSFHGQAKVLVDITYHGNTIKVSYRGMQWTQPLTHRINTWTNARLLRGVVHAKAREAALAAVPQTKRSIIEKLDQELRTGIASQSANFERYFLEISRSMQDVPGATPKLTSDQSGAYFQHHIALRQGSVVKNPPHTPADADAGFLFHQDTFTSLLAQSLDGNTIKIEDLGQAICKSFSKSLYKFCASEKKMTPIDLSVKFANKDAAKFLFNDGILSLKLTSQARVSTNDQTSSYLQGLVAKAAMNLTQDSEQPGTVVQNDEATNQISAVSHLTPDIEIKVDYRLGNRRFERGLISVNIVSALDEGGYLTRQTLYRQGLIKFLELKIAEALPLTIDVPAVPSYASSNADVKNVGGSLVVMRKEHFGIKDNWLFSYFSYCNAGDTQTALGINMRSIEDSEKHPRLKVTSVGNSTPAGKAAVIGFKSHSAEDQNQVSVDYQPAPGLRINDVIYSVDGSDALVASPEVFSGSLAGKSLTSDGKVVLKVGRFETLQGLDAPVWMMIDLQVTLRKVCLTAI
jgi:hypothetical protein